jgi:hypothetical protein
LVTTYHPEMSHFLFFFLEEDEWPHQLAICPDDVPTRTRHRLSTPAHKSHPRIVFSWTNVASSRSRGSSQVLEPNPRTLYQYSVYRIKLDRERDRLFSQTQRPKKNGLHSQQGEATIGLRIGSGDSLRVALGSKLSGPLMIHEQRQSS